MVQTMGIREFRDSFTRIAREAVDPVIIKNHGRVVGWFTPTKRDPEELKRDMAEVRAMQAEWRASGRDLEAELASLGMDPDGIPLDEKC